VTACVAARVSGDDIASVSYALKLEELNRHTGRGCVLAVCDEWHDLQSASRFASPALSSLEQTPTQRRRTRSRDVAASDASA
jgi:hypothetical protein